MKRRGRRELCLRNMCTLASNFVDYGFTVFLDTVVQDRATLELLVTALSPRPVRLIVLAPSIDVCRHRNSTRPEWERFEFDGYEQLDADMDRGLDTDAWWFDTSAVSPEQTAEKLVREAAERARPLHIG